ncbi:hypothetical protein H0E87_009821 [Populus deltoides]|uniref:Uncharacterized protein n=1 Tax=Populus deltoides TaxID=3696 RepID=A0A8T2YR67_POPDE|nr:hypothetical protein H0E87_009821 [Populus deltoides]
MASCLVLLVLAFFVFSTNVVDAQVTVYCQASDYNNEVLMQWMYANGISCQPITSSTTTPSISSKSIEVDCDGSRFYVDENVLEWIYANNIPCHPITRSKKRNKLPIILGTVIPIFCLFWAIVGFIVHHKRKTAAIAAITTGQVDGANKHTQGSLSADGIKIDIHDQTSQGIGDQYPQQQQESNNA